MLNENNIGKVSKELNTLLKYIPNLKIEKLPRNFLNFLEKNEDKSYDFKLDSSKKISEQNIMNETKLLFIAIYRDFFATEEDKIKIDKKLIENDKKYDINNIFKKTKKENANINSSIQLVKYKNNPFQKLINFFNKNKILGIGKIITLENRKKYIILLKCNIDKLDYYLICNKKNQNDILIIQNYNGSKHIKVIKDYNLIKHILEKM